MDFKQLVAQALSVTRPRTLSSHATCAGVGAAIYTKGGNVYLGVCIDTASSMGFCAEHAAAAAMITAGESEIAKVVAVNAEGKVYPPCGRCREFLLQLNDTNAYAEVMVDENTVVPLHQLMPYSWHGIE